MSYFKISVGKLFETTSWLRSFLPYATNTTLFSFYYMIR